MRIRRRSFFQLALAAGFLAAFLFTAQAARSQATCNQQLDADCDEVPDTLDNCKYIYNPNQANSDASEETPPYLLGDVCDRDDDNDGVMDDAGLGSVCPSADSCQSSRTCSVSRSACTSNIDCNGGSHRDFCMVQLQSCLSTGQPCNADADCPIIADVCGNHCTLSNASCDPLNDMCSATGCNDNCPFSENPNQVDGDGDDAGDACDNCLAVVNTSQANADDDLFGDACDADIDGDIFEQDPSIAPVCSVVPNSQGNPPGPPDTSCRDNCPFQYNVSQWDHDRDLVGTACDNCIVTDNPSQLDVDSDQVGDPCDNCLSAPNSSQANGDTDALGDQCDNCQDADNNLQIDSDFDGIGDSCDSCPGDYDPGQPDTDGDGTGDACDPCPVDFSDLDGDGVCNSTDNCPVVANTNQTDADDDGDGDVCDCDRDGDGINDKNQRSVPSGTEACFSDQLCTFLIAISPAPACNSAGGLTPPCCIDNCPDAVNPGQANGDADQEGDTCDPTPAVSQPGPSGFFDADGDSAADASDNCPAAFNSGQDDLDADSVGDICDADLDGDGLMNVADNCARLSNPGQDDTDGDRYGDLCDNCRWVSNHAQGDFDADSQGDRCDVDDGQISLQFDAPGEASWDAEETFDRWITVVGDLELLRSSGQYLQDPAVNPVAALHCDSSATSLLVGDIDVAPGQIVFIFTGGVTGAIENGFGQASNGGKRVNQDVCP